MIKKTSTQVMVDNFAFFSTSEQERAHIVSLIVDLCGNDKAKLNVMEEIIGWAWGEGSLHESYESSGEDQ